MRTIWKTTLKLTDTQEIDVPKDARMLHVREQYNEIYIWYACSTELPTEKRTIFICGTGHALPDSVSCDSYLGTVSLCEDSLIVHVFEILT